MTIVYFANPMSPHDCKWINHFSSENNVIVVTAAENEGEYRFLNNGIEVFPILPRYSVIKWMVRSKVKRKLQKLIEERKVDIIHSMYAVPNAIWVSELEFKKHLITTRGSDILVDYLITYKKPKSMLQKITFPLMLRKIYRSIAKASAVTSTSKPQLEEVNKIRVETKNCHLIRTGVDKEVFKPYPKNDGEWIRIFSPRSMKPLYNIEVIVKAYAIALKSNDRLKLVLLDDESIPSYSNQINELILSLGIGDSVEKLSYLNQVQIVEQYQKAHLTIMVPQSDGTPNSAIESMLMNTPVILSPLDYDEDLFNQKTVWKSQSYEPFEISEIILSILNQDVTEKVSNARNSALEYASLQSSLSKIETIYSNMCHG